MELSTRTIRDVIHPTAIFCDTNDNDRENNESKPVDPSWENSRLNPKNRIDSLEPPKHPLWRIDGCAGLGTHFYAIPLFLREMSPMRVDLFIDESIAEAPEIRELLDMDTVFHTRDRVRLQRQGICSYILRALQAWTMKGGRDIVEALYNDGPFGSRIYFSNLPLKVEDVDVKINYFHELERHQKTVQDLAHLWKGTVKSIPPTVDINKLVFVKQLHDSVCVVQYRSDSKGTKAPEWWVMKALTTETSLEYMYHELRVLLTMPPHPNIISSPRRLVTKTSSLLKHQEKVVGFLVPFYSGGGLRDELPLLRLQGLLRVEDQTRWAKDICSGLLHIRYQASSFYPDLRLDQIVFPAGKRRPIILDFEQRGVWCEFAAPEINALECLMAVAQDDADEDDRYAIDEAELGNYCDAPSWPSRREFRAIALEFYANCRSHTKTTKHYKLPDYNNPPMGYNVPWNYITREEQEYAEVYMFGRLLWCLFEGMSSPQRGAIWCSYRHEPEFDFPEFRRTPPALRPLIEQCARGRRNQLSELIVRKGSRVVLRDDRRGHGTPEEIKAVAKKFWTEEVRWAQDFVSRREAALVEGTLETNHFGRPTMHKVYQVLEAFQAGL